MVRFGLVGTGLAAGTHARELQKVSGARLESVFARDPAKARRFADKHGARKSTADLDKFLSDPDIDAVIVATPNGLHHDIAIAAAEAGKHVVVEKPLEITTSRAQSIVEACRAANTRLFVIYQMRFSAAAQQAKADIEAGRLGKVILVNVADNEFRTAAYYAADAWRGTMAFEGGGCLVTQTSHLLDLIQYLVGPVESAFAYAATALHQIETEDVAVAALRFANGALCTVSSSTAAFPAQRHLVTISGTEGSICFNGEHDQIVFRAVNGKTLTSDVPPGFSFADPQDPLAFPTYGQRRQLQMITDSLGLSEPTADEREADHLQATRLLDAIYLSAKERREVLTSEFGAGRH